MARVIRNEHFVPDHGTTLEDYFERREKTPVHHLIRYRWAEAVIEKLAFEGPILDIACGAGYGTYGIAKRYPQLEVVGGDYDAEAIAFAQENYRSPNLRFERADLTRWVESLGTRRYGCVISFDTIEHIEHREIAMQNIAEHLTSDGALLLSTPVRSHPVLNPGWEHHKIEFSKVTLYDFLRRYFARVGAPDLATLPCVDVFDAINGEDEFYLLKMNPVVCQSPLRIEFGK